MQPTIEQIERQQAFEAYCVRKGVDRYRSQVAGSTLGDTQPGLIATKDMMSCLTPAITVLRDEAVKGITSAGSGRQPSWWWIIGFIEPEALAYITVRSVLCAYNANDGNGRPVTSVALNIAGAVRDEIEMRRWAKAEKDRAKEDDTYLNMHRLLTTRSQKVDRAAFARWKRKLKHIEREEWTTQQRLDIGTMLLNAAVAHGGGWFEVRRVYGRGVRTYKVFLTDVATRAINDINARLEVNRPYLLPMKCPPKAWQKETT